MRCWAGGTGSPAALEGTADGGRSWSLVTASSQGSFDEGSVSCLSVSACVATADNGLWVPADDGGLAGQRPKSPPNGPWSQPSRKRLLTDDTGTR